MRFTSKVASRIPTSTYRLQLNKNFAFKQASQVISYLHRLGVSDLYLSPILRARSGSMHCYDVTDHTMLNPEIGNLRQFRKLAEEIQVRGMGILLDIVPNHMAISEENPRLMNVLEYGPFSKYSDFFDVNWRPLNAPDLQCRLVLPILGTKITEALRKGHVSIVFSKNGKLFLQVYSSKLPLTPRSYERILSIASKSLTNQNEKVLKLLNKVSKSLVMLPNSLVCGSGSYYPFEKAAADMERIRKLCVIYPQIRRTIIDTTQKISNSTKWASREIRPILDDQFYKLEYWKDGINRLNYRRFATVTDLIAVCAEKPSVFDESHSFVLQLIAEGKITGLRIDHIDGLFDPSNYLARLQKECIAHLKHEKNPLTSERPFFVVVEKILEKDEELSAKWQIHGTTGYEFLCDLNNIFVESSNSLKFDRIYSNFISKEITLEKIVELSRRNILNSSLKSELIYLTGLLSNIFEGSGFHDFCNEDLKDAIKEIALWFPTYRTYSSFRVSDSDRRYVKQASGNAMRCLKERAHIISRIEKILLLDFPKGLSLSQRKKWRLFDMRFQQLTAPIAAKGIEDTVFYIYNRLVSLNEVGGNPGDFGISIKEFHRRNFERLQTHPHSLLATSTHDTKRSEDVRARINVLSEIPEQWSDFLRSCNKLNAQKKSILYGESCPSKNDEYMLYETMIGVFPYGKVKITNELVERISSYMNKAVREAKIETSWIDQNQAYEEGLQRFIKELLDKNNKTFFSNFQKIHDQTSYHGMLNSLSQILLKLTCPGIPDIYEGNEIWDYSLVDPDNRRPVDFQKRSKMLSYLERRIRTSKPEELALFLMSNMEHGLIKMYVLHRGLEFRSGHQELFKQGEYIPLSVLGTNSDHICSFMRKTIFDQCIVIAPRLFVSLLKGRKYQNAKGVWGNTTLILPKESDTDAAYFDIFTGKKVTISKGNHLALSQILGDFPVALLYRQ